MKNKVKDTAKTRYNKKIKYIRVDFYLKDSPLWDYILYLRDEKVSVQGFIKDALYNKMCNDEEYKKNL